MAELVFTNNASSLLAASIDDNDVTIQVDSGDGELYPDPGAGQFFKVALVNASGDLEICHCTSRAGDLLTVVRAQEGTAAQSWVNGATRVELRLTANTMERMLQKSGDTMTGNLLMDDNEIQDARLTGDTVVEGGQLVGTALRGTEDDASNQVVVPSDGSRATAGGSPVVVLADNLMTLLPIGTMLMWHGSLGSLPAGWQNCDGTNGTPDMRGMFPRGAGGAIALGATGGSATAAGNTDAAGGHTHTAAGDPFTLTTAEMPAHSHELWGDTSAAQTQTEGLGGPQTESVAGRTANVVNSFMANTGEGGDPMVSTVGGGGAHSHTVTVDAVANHTHGLSAIATVPPYVGIYFIKKVA